MKTPQIVSAILLALATLMSGCASETNRGNVYGVVDRIEVTRGDSGGIGAGAVIGGVVGGVVGNQVGSGSGRDAATVAGAVGGAVVGHEIQKGNQQQDLYRIGVRLDNGGYQTVTQQGSGDLRIGDRVRIEDGRAIRY